MQPARARVEPSEAPKAETLEFECDESICVFKCVRIQAVQCKLLTRKCFQKFAKCNFPKIVAGKMLWARHKLECVLAMPEN